jgi:hypothetical protein
MEETYFGHPWDVSFLDEENVIQVENIHLTKSDLQTFLITLEEED